MDETKLNPLALKMAKDLMIARPSVPLATAIGVANYKLANICSQLKIQVNTRSGYGNTPANIYQLLLLNSGGGKGATLTLIDNFYFKDAFTYMKEVVYPKFKAKALDRLEMEENDRPIHEWVKSNSNFTTSGMFAYAESYELSKIGGLNIEVDEIGNAVTSKAELFELLLQPYDNGILDPVGKRTDPDAMSIKGMSINMYCFGNKVRLFEGDNVEFSFIKLLDEGYGRRMIFIDDVSEPKSKTPEDIVREMKASEDIVEKRKEDREFIKSLITRSNLGKVMELDDEALYEFAKIKADGDNYVIENKGLQPAVKSDMSERVFKTAKLAGIYAFFDGSDKIEAKHMIQAFEIIKYSSEVLKDLRKIRPLHKRLLERLLDEPKAVTSQHCLSYPFIPSGWSKKVNEIILLAKELASEEGLVWDEKSVKGVMYYSVSEDIVNANKELEEEDVVAIKEEDVVTDEEEALLALLYE